MPTPQRKLPKLQDEVRHIEQEFSGTVIAKYKDDKGLDVLDIRLSGMDSVYYGTPAINWETVRTEEETW